MFEKRQKLLPSPVTTWEQCGNTLVIGARQGWSIGTQLVRGTLGTQRPLTCSISTSAVGLGAFTNTQNAEKALKTAPGPGGLGAAREHIGARQGWPIGTQLVRGTLGTQIPLTFSISTCAGRTRGFENKQNGRDTLKTAPAPAAPGQFGITLGLGKSGKSTHNLFAVHLAPKGP